MEKYLKSKIRDIKDWPKEGVNFKDITTLLEDGKAFRKAINAMARPFLKTKIDKVVGIDARGFIIASAMAYKLKTGLAIVRKKGKLPSKTISRDYGLEYANDTIEMHEDTILPGEKVLIVDDLLATGGTMEATISMVNQLKGEIVGISFLIELTYLKGKIRLGNYNIHSIIKYNE
jgi:adenine phosphoribosyltransferase